LQIVRLFVTPNLNLKEAVPRDRFLVSFLPAPQFAFARVFECGMSSSEQGFPLQGTWHSNMDMADEMIDRVLEDERSGASVEVPGAPWEQLLT
jgi:hypothetical protein